MNFAAAAPLRDSRRCRDNSGTFAFLNPPPRTRVPGRRLRHPAQTLANPLARHRRETADLLRQFAEAKPITDAIIAFSRLNDTNPRGNARRGLPRPPASHQ